ncbi:MAG: glycosyltransferase [Bacteroidales bacterium]
MAKIIILGSAYPLRAGGLSTFNERLAQQFKDMGHEVIIYTFSLQYPSFLFPGKTQYAIRPAPENLEIRVKVNSINPLNWWLVGRQIRKEKADLLVIRYWLPFMAPCLGTIAAMVRKNKKTKVVTIADNIIPHEKRPGDKLLTQYYVNRSDGFVTLSKAVLKDLEKFDRKNKPKVYSPHPLYDNFGDKMPREEALLRLKLSSDYRYVLFFGFIRDYKGLDILLNAMGEQILLDLPIKLIVAGEFYSSDQPYMKIIREKGLGSRVILHTQFIPNEKVAAYFCASDLVVQPYKDATQSGVTQVAYHFDVPMVVTNVGALPEMVPNNVAGLVVKPDAEKVARAIHRFFDKNMAEELKRGLQTQKDRFSWSKLVEATFEAAEISPEKSNN